jgi:hypothetical protein
MSDSLKAVDFSGSFGPLMVVERSLDERAIEAVTAVCGLPGGVERTALLRELAGILARINSPVTVAEWGGVQVQESDN